MLVCFAMTWFSTCLWYFACIDLEYTCFKEKLVLFIFLWFSFECFVLILFFIRFIKYSLCTLCLLDISDLQNMKINLNKKTFMHQMGKEKKIFSWLGIIQKICYLFSQLSGMAPNNVNTFLILQFQTIWNTFIFFSPKHQGHCRHCHCPHGARMNDCLYEFMMINIKSKLNKSLTGKQKEQNMCVII